MNEKTARSQTSASERTETAVFAGGCFWCTEALFKSLRGVVSVMPGYTGGSKPNPTYEEVNTGRTGHAESVKIGFDPSLISYDDLLSVFFNTHDPTTLNRQGNDIGTDYRSAIFYTSDAQKEAAQETIRELDAAHAYADAIVTDVVPLETFYPAEDYHRDYFEAHSGDPYCEIVIAPKLEKMQKRFASLLKAPDQNF